MVRRRWLSDHSFSDLVALSQFLPGPSSSQVGIAIGLQRGGYTGAFAAWLGFTLPSALLLAAFAMSLGSWGSAVPAGVLHGLKLLAVAVVAQAVWGMARSTCTDARRALIAAIAVPMVLLAPSVAAQIGVIVFGALAGLLLLRSLPPAPREPLNPRVGRAVGGALLAVFALLLVALPVLARLWPEQTLALIATFYRAASLVFGGGHVVLPLLQAAVVPPGWVSNETFLAGYGAAQVVPGPLFTFAAFLGAAIAGWPGAAICLIAVFLPSFLLVIGAMPFWEHWRRARRAQAALAGINAAVVGLLAGALYDPVWASAVFEAIDVVIVVAALAALQWRRWPVWLVGPLCAVAGWLAGAG